MEQGLDTTPALKALGDPAQRPTLEQVRDREIRFYPRHWLARWPQGLAIPPFLQQQDADDDGRRSVTREELFALAGEGFTTPSEAVNFYTAVCAWGAGTFTRGIARVIRPLRDSSTPDRLVEGLIAAAECGAGEADPVEVYRQFSRGGEWRIKYLGPAFFTKLMYFAAGAPVVPVTETEALTIESAVARHPLILDRRVARALGWSRRWGWSPEQYGDYLETVQELRDLWCPQVPVDVLEYRLFIAGGRSG